jgi:hypothetical protein
MGLFVRQKAISIRNLLPSFLGCMVGIAVFSLAAIRFSCGVGNTWQMWSYILESPVWLMVPHPDAIGPYVTPVAFLVLVLEYSLAGWLVGKVIHIARRHRKTALIAITFFVVTFCIGYGATWTYARDMVRAEIKRQRAEDYQRRRDLNPSRVLREPELQIMFCAPICPLVIACEYDYVYGGLDGWGEGSLWFWRGRDVKEFFTYAYWRY